VPAGQVEQVGRPLTVSTPWPAGQVSHSPVDGLRNSLSPQALLQEVAPAAAAAAQGRQAAELPCSL
jgi:hypothetical protein